jgi:uncharacterized protein YcbX
VRLARIYRYPVKSMAGERLERAVLGREGVAGDRTVQVREARGKIVTARTHPALLGFHARLGEDGEPLVDGLPWDSPRIARRVREAAGPGASLVRAELSRRFDVLPLLVATDGTLEAFGRGERRLRPNLVIEGVEGLDERGWEGRALRVGDAIVRLADLRRRCVMTTFDPDTLEQDLEVLRRIVTDFDGALALNASVERGGPISEGDPVLLVDPPPAG